MTSTAVLIPARYGSTRFPGKPLCRLGDLHMIQHVYKDARSAGYDTYVLTDNMLIGELFADHTLIVDTEPYENGTERCAGAVLKCAKLEQYDRFINVQGDMPGVTVGMIKTVDRILRMNYPLATLFKRMEQTLQNDSNSVKLITDNSGKALWFGRGVTGYGEHHLGVYGYHRDMLEKYPQLQKYPEEDIEKLEQLRWLKNSCNMQCGMVEWDGIEINTPDDVRKWHESNNG